MAVITRLKTMIALIRKNNRIWKLDHSNLDGKEAWYCIEKFDRMQLPDHMETIKIVVPNKSRDLKTVTFELTELAINLVKNPVRNFSTIFQNI